MLKTPFIFITCHVQFRLSESERVNLGEYLGGGGFLFADDCEWRPGGPADISLRTMIKDALASQRLAKGLDWTWEVLPKDHPIYHCYPDFEGASRTPYTICRYTGAIVLEPQGITLRGRLVAVYSQWDIGCTWEGPRLYSRISDIQYHRVQQLGISMLIFAMTQEGSITQRLMSSVR